MATNTKRSTKSIATPGKYGEFSISTRDGKFKVFKQGKFCCHFATLAQAEHYIDEHRQPRRIVLTPAP